MSQGKAVSVLAFATLFGHICCTKADRAVAKIPEPRPSILLITLDTTRADNVGPEAKGVDTPAFNAVAKRGHRFRQAYATAPETLPSHVSMMTGLYPAAHRIHENARYLGEDHPVLAQRLREAGYHTAAFVSGYPLAQQFGLARGFDLYDDEMTHGGSERSGRETTDRAVAYLRAIDRRPYFVWVHYFEPHSPYEPPEPFRSRYAGSPYQGEIAAMDQELGRLLQAIEKSTAIVIAGDHGEALGEHGEAQHGNLLYQGAMLVPLVLAGPGIKPKVTDPPVSIRRVFHTILDWAGIESDNSLRTEDSEIVLGEGMKPFLSFGWQPQIMAVEGRQKVIHAGKIEIYDVIADPSESRDLADEATLSRQLRQALQGYPIPSAEPPAQVLSDEDRRQLASLGYVSADIKPVIRADAPRPRDMIHLFETLDKASSLFVREEYSQAIPLLEKILAEDPHNLMTALRLAAAHSALGRNEGALAAFRLAESIAPGSVDVSHYLALHYLRTGKWERAEPLLERVLAQSPDRLPALEAMARIRERQGRYGEALSLWQKVLSRRTPEAGELINLGEVAMRAGNTPVALRSFERARGLQGPSFRHDLELGVLYLETRRFTDARDALERVADSHPAYPMALFKRAQVSALLREPDLSARIEEARKHSDATTRELIAQERLFQGPQ